MSFLIENEDWQVTREIYEDAIVDESDDTATLRIPISLINMIAIRVLLPVLEEEDNKTASITNSDSSDPPVEIDKFQVNPRFQYLVLSELGDPPILEVSFHYPNKDSDCYPDSVEISILQYPKLFPFKSKELWTEWLSNEANKALQESMLSFSVCNFVEIESMRYFETLNHLEFSAIVFRSNLFGYYDASWEGINKHPEKSRLVEDIRLKKKLPKATENIHKFARQILKRNWKKYYEYECPICFCPESCDDGVELPCDHFYCKDCISMYASTIIADIQLHRSNPFICPIPTCKENMNVMPSQSKMVKRSCDILSKTQIERVLLWEKDIAYPLCHDLSMCPLSSCGAKGMRKLNNHNTNTLCSCEECNAIFCELCLKRIPKNKIGFDHREECDESKVLKLIRRYNRAPPDIQSKCHEKLKWIKEYASSRELDASAALWVKEFASMCPNCKNAIERSHGCFHMHCTTCGTHFCYECGEEIFYPFYGTHHCWEREVDEIQFNLFG